MKAILVRAKKAAKRIPDGLTTDEDTIKYVIAASFFLMSKLVFDIYLEYKRNAP